MPTDKGPNVIEVSPSDTPQAIATKITPDAKPVVILLGSYDDKLSPNVRSMFIRGLLPMACDAKAVVLDDGAPSGCAADLGASSLEVEEQPVLVGVTAASGPYEPNHAYVAHIAEAGADSWWTFHLASALAKCDDAAAHKAVTLVVIGGAEREKTALARAARKRWPIVLVTGAGGISDEVATAWKGQKDTPPAPPPTDAVLSGIVQDGNISTFDLKENVDDLKRILSAQLQKNSEGLEAAWAWYVDLDQAAQERQTTFRKNQNLLLILAVVATLLAILSKTSLPAWMGNYPKVFGGATAFIAAHKEGFSSAATSYYWLLNIILIVVPIVVTYLTARNNRFRAGNKWILLRAAAEGIKREIFQFRAQAGAYSNSQCTLLSRSAKLSAKVKDITQSLVQSEVNKSSITHQPPVDTSKLTFLTPDNYVEARIDDQVGYYEKKTKDLNTQLHQLYNAILLAGAAGTLVAALGVPVWVALTTALATALTTKLEIENTEESLVQYNIALTSLRNIKAWWNSLSNWEKDRPRNIDLLVEQTEQALAGELAGWVQQMQSALEKLTEKQDTGKKNGGGQASTQPEGGQPSTAQGKQEPGAPKQGEQVSEERDTGKSGTEKTDTNEVGENTGTEKPSAEPSETNQPDTGKSDAGDEDTQTTDTEKSAADQSGTEKK